MNENIFYRSVKDLYNINLLSVVPLVSVNWAHRHLPVPSLAVSSLLFYFYLILGHNTVLCSDSLPARIGSGGVNECLSSAPHLNLGDNSDPMVKHGVSRYMYSNSVYENGDQLTLTILFYKEAGWSQGLPGCLALTYLLCPLVCRSYLI